MVRINDLFYKEAKSLATPKAIEKFSKMAGVKTTINENYAKDGGHRYEVEVGGKEVFSTNTERTIVLYLTLNVWNVANGGKVVTLAQLEKLGEKWNLLKEPTKAPAKKKVAKKKATKKLKK